jgi:hypothetical protein
MKKKQLFKRLYAISLGDLAIFSKFDEQISTALLRLDLAARTRHIIQTVQLEDTWQSFHHKSNAYRIYLSMRLSPMTLCSVLDSKESMNCLEWQLLIPKYEDIAEDLRPRCFGEYLQLADRLEIVDIENYDIAEACRFLDKAYDFSWQTDRPGHTT